MGLENLYSWSGLVFVATVAATFVVVVFARFHSPSLDGKALAEQKLNKWLIGLSAGATANSGFIVTAGVSLGYLYGLQWLLLPIAWLIGDVIFWTFFPGRINKYGASVGAQTITDIVAGETGTRLSKWIAVGVGLMLVLGLTGYTSAQFLAGQKFINGAFDIEPVPSLVLFGIVIVMYTAVGGFRGSVYADSFMAVVRIVGTAVAIGCVLYVALIDFDAFRLNMAGVEPEFLNIFGMGNAVTILGFVLGFAAASLGFGLGQPQIVSRYLAGKDEDETQAAWWIYIAFVQVTWISMTLFGLMLRGVMPSIDDPEAGLSIFFASNFGPILTGIIVADIFATIAATSNSLLVAMAQSLKRDLIERIGSAGKWAPLWLLTMVLGATSMFVSLNIDTTVLNLAVTSVSILGAAIAPAMIVKVVPFRHSELSIALSIVVGVFIAVSWKVSGYSALINEAAPGILSGLVVNALSARIPFGRS